MHITSRSYLTAGIATLGVGALTLAPVQPIPHQLDLAPQRVVSSLAVELAAAVDPITAWVNVFQTSAANIEILGKFNEQNPFPLLKTIGANIATYIEEISNGQIDLVFEQIGNNIQTFFTAPWDPGNTATLQIDWNPPRDPKDVTVATGEYLSNTEPAPLPGTTPATLTSPFGINLLVLQLTAGASQTPSEDSLIFFNTLAPVLRILNTPATGQIISWLGPLLSPVVALTNSFTAVGKNFQEGKILDALYELINIPANMTNAFLNGAGFLNLAPLINVFYPLPEAFKDLQAGINLGGLLNAVPQNGSLVNPDQPPSVWAGGTGLDSVAIPGCGGKGGGGGGGEIDFCEFIEGQPPTGLRNGLFGAGIGLGQFLAEKLLITPPQETPASAKLAAPEAAAPALPEAPAAQEAAPVEAPVEDTAPADFEVAADDPAPADDAGADAGAAVVSEVLEVEAPADFAEVTEIAEVTEVAEDSAPAPAAAVGSDDSDSGDTGRASDSRRGAANAD